ncbi:MAG: hypothetical protein FWG75_09150 [Cystobacterineae bacterium]|nr:hypothetical protein [Cystobacterineae bacterium]
MRCPSEISNKLLQVQKLSPEWQGYIKTRLPLTTAGFSKGFAEGHRSPTLINEIRGKLIHTWKFVGPYPHGKWLICDYGPLSLSKRVDDFFSECSIIFKMDKKRHWVIERVSCK